jgi:hypothetical protein
MNPDELTQIVTAHQSAIGRIEGILLELAQAHRQTQAQQQINTQAIAALTASLQELRNLVGDYIQGRSQI